MSINKNPVTGTKEYLPKEAEARQMLIEKILHEYQRNGFLLIKTPILEHLDNLLNGDSGDNTKLMFKTIKRGEKLNLTKPNLTEKDIVEEGLRYDLTVPLARFFLGNKNDLPIPFKAIQIDDAFRAEKPQKGRYRQFTQCDIDIFGDNSALAEIELLITAGSVYKSFGLENAEIRISSRKLLTEMILNSGYKQEEVNSVCVIVDKLDKIGIENVEAELKAISQTNPENFIEVLKKVKESGLSYLETICNKAEVDSLKEVIEVVKENLPKGFNIVFDITIVRGQGYYTGTVFEVYDTSTGFTRSIGGGGRYDNMVKNFGGEEISAVGFSIGLDATMVVLNDMGKLFSKNKVALVYYKETTKADILKAKTEYLNKNPETCVSIFPFPKNFNEFERKAKLNGFTEIIKIK